MHLKAGFTRYVVAKIVCIVFIFFGILILFSILAILSGGFDTLWGFFLLFRAVLSVFLASGLLFIPIMVVFLRLVESYLKFKPINRTTRIREPIPGRVKMNVWNRDGGRCVSCGSNRRLEYDHIIPLAKGGSNTDRNLQLLCQDCNRSKAANITIDTRQ